MPHILIEYAQGAFPESAVVPLLDAVHGAVCECGLFEADNVKTRLHPVQTWRLAAPYEAFVAVQCRIHGGRSAEQKQGLSHSVLQALRPHCPSATVLTVEVVEMERPSYAKDVV